MREEFVKTILRPLSMIEITAEEYWYIADFLKTRIRSSDLHHSCTLHQPVGTVLCSCHHHDGPMGE